MTQGVRWKSSETCYLDVAQDEFLRLRTIKQAPAESALRRHDRVLIVHPGDETER